MNVVVAIASEFQIRLITMENMKWLMTKIILGKSKGYVGKFSTSDWLIDKPMRKLQRTLRM